MPNYDDLKFLKDKILTFGDELNILTQKNLPLNDTPIPVTAKEKTEATSEVKTDEGTDQLLNEIMDDFQSGFDMTDQEVSSNEIPDNNEIPPLSNELSDLDISGNETGEQLPAVGMEELDDLLNGTSSIDDSLNTADNPVEADQQESSGDENLDDLMASFNQPPSSDDGAGDLESMLNESSEQNEFIGQPEEPADENLGTDNLDDLMANLSETLPTEETVNPDEVPDSLANLKESLKDSVPEELSDTPDLDDLLIDSETPVETKSFTEDIIEESSADLDNDQKESDGINELDALLSETGLNSESADDKQDDFIGGFDQDISNIDNELNNLEGGFTDIPTEDQKADYKTGDDILDKLGEDESFAESIKKESESNILDDLLDNAEIGDSSFENLDGLSGGFEDTAGIKEDFSDLSNDPEDFNFDELSTGKTKEPDESGFSEDLESLSEGIDNFDIEQLESLSSEKTDKSFSESFDIPEPDISITPNYQDSSEGKIPSELSKSDISQNQDEELVLNDADRKQIILTLASLPKEAEIKIAKAITSNKYSNSQLTPLIDALIKKSPSHIIIKYYEKITGDKSLAHIDAVKYTGQKFEELQKSFTYVFQKNILPLLSIIIFAAGIFIILFLLITRFLWPSWQASTLYNKGKAKIHQKIFWEAEDYFNRAFEIQPRFSEAFEYAKLYRKYKRYIEAEKKYDLATNMNPNRLDLALDFADFFREIKSYERAEKKYKSMIISNEKNIPAMLGLARTYVDWSEESKSKLEDAKSIYYDILDIDKKNKEAIYGNFNIFIKEKDHKKIMDYYNYTEKYFSRKIDSTTYSNLAEYFINNGELDEVKHILEQAIKSKNKNEYLPEIDYQWAQYKKVLNIANEEKNHLLNALSQFEKMQNKNPDQYNTVKYQNLLAKVYNDLGENYDKSGKANLNAEKYYLKAIQANPNYGKAYYNLANFSLYNKPDGYLEAKQNYLEAEEKGFQNDQLFYNLSWLYYRERDFQNSYRRLVSIYDNYPHNTNLSLMLGTILYQLGKYEISESLLLESYLYLNDLTMKYTPLDPERSEDRFIYEMLKKTSNNLGATYQKIYEEKRKSKYLINATKYYSDSLNYFDFLNRNPVKIDQEEPENNISKFTKEHGNINLRMVLYPYAGEEEPFLYENFPLDFSASTKYR